MVFFRKVPNGLSPCGKSDRSWGLAQVSCLGGDFSVIFVGCVGLGRESCRRDLASLNKPVYSALPSPLQGPALG